MGGLYSGRKRTHTSIDDCLVIDATWLRKRKLITRAKDTGFSIEWIKSTRVNFVEKKEKSYTISALFSPGDHPTLLLAWRADATLASGEKKHANHQHLIHLESTACNYGGQRWWFTCPGCAHRVRVLYLDLANSNVEAVSPRCRNCLDLHYSSQLASYIDRHKAYERHLLANYGLYWAAHRYDFELKEHYLKMTPELWALRMKSVIDWNTHLLKLIIRCDITIYRTNLANLKSLRSEEDRRVYLEHMRETERNLNTANFALMLQGIIEHERMMFDIHMRATHDELFGTYANLADLGEDPIQSSPDGQSEIEAVENKIISLEKFLRKVNKAEKKKKAA